MNPSLARRPLTPRLKTLLLRETFATIGFTSLTVYVYSHTLICMSTGVQEKMVAKFRESTDELLNGIPDDEIAEALGCSVALVRQARLREGAKARRSPPAGWEIVCAKLAEQKAMRLNRLAAKLRAV
jgi:hypothetical protein